MIIILPITNGSTCWPAQLYHGGRPAVYIVRLFERKIDSVDVIVVLWLIDVVRCLLGRGERTWDPGKTIYYVHKHNLSSFKKILPDEFDRDFTGTVVGDAGQQ